MNGTSVFAYCDTFCLRDLNVRSRVQSGCSYFYYLGIFAMLGFRIFMVAIFVAIFVYTAVTISNHGWNLIPIFFGDMQAMAWPGQFNFDFMTFLLLSGFWVSWRHHFSAKGLLLGLVAVFGGMLFLSLYLYITSIACKGNVKELLMGKSRAEN